MEHDNGDKQMDGKGLGGRCKRPELSCWAWSEGEDKAWASSLGFGWMVELGGGEGFVQIVEFGGPEGIEKLPRGDWICGSGLRSEVWAGDGDLGIASLETVIDAAGGGMSLPRESG